MEIRIFEKDLSIAERTALAQWCGGCYISRDEIIEFESGPVIFEEKHNRIPPVSRAKKGDLILYAGNQEFYLITADMKHMV